MSEINYEDIKLANESITKTLLKSEKNGKEIGDYVEVNQRIKAFRINYPQGLITTRIEKLENGLVIMQALVYECDCGKLLATGYAYEKENSTFINKTSFIENCETSAIGRALGICGYGIDTSLASYEEVGNAVAQQEQAKEPKQEVDVELANIRLEIKKLCADNMLDFKNVVNQYKITATTSKDRLKEIIELIKEEIEFNNKLPFEV